MTSLRRRPWRTRLVTTKLHCVCFVTTSHSNVNNVNYLSKLSAIVSHRGDICAISESKRPICPSPSTGLSAFRYRFLHAELGTGVFRSNASETSRADGSRTVRCRRKLDFGRRSGASVGTDFRHPEIDGSMAEGSKFATVLQNRKHATVIVSFCGTKHNSSYSIDNICHQTPADRPCRYTKRVSWPILQTYELYSIAPECIRTSYFETVNSDFFLEEDLPSTEGTPHLHTPVTFFVANCRCCCISYVGSFFAVVFTFYYIVAVSSVLLHVLCVAHTGKGR